MCECGFWPFSTSFILIHQRRNVIYKCVCVCVCVCLCVCVRDLVQPEDTTVCCTVFCLGIDLGRGNLNQTLQLSSGDAKYYTRPNKGLELLEVYKGFGEMSYKMYCEAQLAALTNT